MLNDIYYSILKDEMASSARTCATKISEMQALLERLKLELADTHAYATRYVYHFVRYRLFICDVIYMCCYL